MALVTAVLLSVTVTGCGDGQKDFVFTNTGVPPAPVVGTGNLTFNFVQAQGVITVPLGTTTLDFTFYDGPSQSGNITKTDSQAYASSVTVVDVPSNTQSYRIVALNANGAPLATATGSVTVVVGQTITVDVTGVTVTLTQPTNTPLNVLVSNNGTGNAGDLDLFNQLFSFVNTFVSGNNQGIALDQIGTAFHNGDTTVNVISQIAGRTGSFDNTLDRAITIAGATNIKGSFFLESSGILVLADFGASQITNMSAQSDGSTLGSFSTPAPPWDLVYDQPNDREFVALTNGSIAVYDDITNTFGSGPARTFTADGLDNAHGIAYDAVSDTLIVSDVGAITTGANDDGELYVFSNASTASGTVTPRAVIGGSNTQLGNPVDIDLQGVDLRVAEKTNDQILIFANILQSTGGNLAPAVAVAETKPESITAQTPVTLGPDNSDIDGGVTVNSIMVSTNNGTTNSIVRMSPTLTDATTPISTNDNNSESLKADARGDVYLTSDTGISAILRLAAGTRDGFPIGAQLDRSGGSFTAAKGLDIVESRGLAMVVDAAADEVVILGKESDFNNRVATTSLPNEAQTSWDLDYDPINDRLFVTNDETVLVYDNYLVGNPSTATPTRTINVTGSVFLHGLVYDAANDVLFLSDVGAVTAGANTDGLLFVINNASTASGNMAPDITIDNGTLGNPVDIAYDGTNLYVAEKTNNVVERYDNIRASAGGNVPASLSVSVTAPESISLVTGL